jgi:peptide deformylase
VILPIITIPDTLLKKVAEPVTDISEHLQHLVDDMIETMRANTRCIGIAAPQVACSVRLVVIDLTLNPKPHPNHGLQVLFNPVITAREGNKTGREGCLSVPYFTGNVARATKVTVNAISRTGAPVTFETEGFEAVLLQHEIDHLDGLLFLVRITSLKTDLFRRK